MSLRRCRGEIARAVLNGGGGKPDPHPTSAQRRGGQASQPNQKMVLAAEAEREIIELLRATPRMGTAEVARATASKTNTVTE
jgi:hypothetical protein